MNRVRGPLRSGSGKKIKSIPGVDMTVVASGSRRREMERSEIGTGEGHFASGSPK